MLTDLHLNPGDQVCGYTVSAKIGQGASGVLWKVAPYGSPSEFRALKILKPIGNDEEQHVVLREVLALSKLNHPNITQISDMGVWHHQSVRYPFVVLEYIEGETLQQLAQKRVSWRVWEQIIRDLLSALSHAHSLGVFHRDIKPDNVLVEVNDAGERVAKIVDFGIARVMQNERGHTHHGVTLPDAGQDIDSIRVLGTPRYMAPEQIAWELGTVGPWTDLYSLGCMLWRLLCLKGPFEGELYTILASHLSGVLPDFEPVIDVPEGFESWLRWLMVKEPYRRCQHPQAAMYALSLLGSVNSSTLSMRVVGDGLDETERAMTQFSLTEIEFMAQRELLLSTTYDLSSFLTLQPQVPESWDSGFVHISKTLEQELIHPVLWRVRPHALVGRRVERDSIWAKFYQSVKSHSPFWFSLSGMDGVGKRHVQSWFVQHVRVVGGAQVLVLDGVVADTEEELIGLVLRELFLLHAVPDAVLKDVLTACFSSRLGVTSEYIERDVEWCMYLFSKSSYQHGVPPDFDPLALFVRVLEHLLKLGPVVVAVRGLESHQNISKALYRVFLEGFSQQRSLFILHVGPEPQALVQALNEGEQPLVRSHERVVLTPLSHELQHRAILSRLPLSDEAAKVLVERTRGDLPLALMHLQKWVHQGMFVHRSYKGAFTLSSDLLDSVARTPDIFWLSLFDEWKQDYADPLLWMALEMAALMTQPVMQSVWEQACETLGVKPEPLFKQLEYMNCIRHHAGGWSFVQGSPKFLFVQNARKAGRIQKLHGLIAQACLDCGQRDDVYGMYLMAAQHLFRADQVAQALEQVLPAAEEAYRWSDDVCLEQIISLVRNRVTQSHAEYKRSSLYRTYVSMLHALVLGERDRALELAEVCRGFARLVQMHPFIVRIDRYFEG